jgi:hypothetical protein
MIDCQRISDMRQYIALGVILLLLAGCSSVPSLHISEISSTQSKIVTLDSNMYLRTFDPATEKWSPRISFGKIEQIPNYHQTGRKMIRVDNEVFIQLAYGKLYKISDSEGLKFVATLQASDGSRRHLIVSSIEHPAVLATARDLEASGYGLTLLPVNREGVVEPALLGSHPPRYPAGLGHARQQRNRGPSAGAGTSRHRAPARGSFPLRCRAGIRENHGRCGGAWGGKGCRKCPGNV